MRFTELSQFAALAILFAIMVLGEVVGKLTKGKVPGALAITVVMLLGFWTILPLDLVERAGVSMPIYSFCAMMLVVNLGTLISRKEMAAQWRTVVISLLGIGAICVITLTAGAALFGWETAVAATPPLTGGIIATTIMQEAFQATNKIAALVALVTFVMQGLAGYPLTSIFLAKEAKRLNKLYQDGTLSSATGAAVQAEEAKESIFTKIKTPAFILFKMVLVALLSYWVEMLLLKVSGGGLYISGYVWCLVLGFLASELKVLGKDSLSQAKSDGLMMNLLLIYLFGGLAVATPELFFPVAGITICLVLLAAVGMAVMAFIASKVFKKESFFMCYSVILTAFYGFPVNVMLTNEAVDNATEDPAARAAITSIIMPKMLVGGFTSVTVVSVVVAGVLINFI